MSLKLIAFIILITGVTLLVSFFFYEGKKRVRKNTDIVSKPVKHKKKGKNTQESIHDLFPEDEPVIEASEPPSTDPYAGYTVNKYLVSRKQNIIYERLEEILSGDFRISPKIRITDLIRPDKKITESDPQRAKFLNNKFNNARFDFVITALDSGEIKGVVMAQSTLSAINCRDFIIGVLEQMKIPLFEYDENREIGNDELSNLLYEKFEEARHE